MEAILGNVMVDCGDETELQNFYAELLGWEKCALFGRPAVRSSGVVVFLFIEEEDYAPQEMFHVEHFASKKTGILTSRLFGGASAPFALVS